MALIKGIDITLYDHGTATTDGFGVAHYTEVAKVVKNVLVSPASSDDLIDTNELFGKKAVYTLCIPKGDTNIWEDRTVEFFGKKWKTFGFVTEYIEENVPLYWNKKVMVERYE